MSEPDWGARSNRPVTLERDLGIFLVRLPIGHGSPDFDAADLHKAGLRQHCGKIVEFPETKDE